MEGVDPDKTSVDEVFLEIWKDNEDDIMKKQVDYEEESARKVGQRSAAETDRP